ncbi:peptide-methionine (R)-S-oxide reductase [Schistosoma bovis]|uniref:Peptide-methionine (R)-S-oxide reductase n=1 Tax=Schistosoma bovis TaxID=6184 RepID=A0A430Q6B1_SCHBO|nr:peptide-methionine (R)-S-oxide reductase [Schistosoma bovis]
MNRKYFNEYKGLVNSVVGKRFSTSSSTSTSQRQMFPPSLPAPPNPAPDLSPVKNQSRRTSAPAVPHRSYVTVENSNNNRTSQINNIETTDLKRYPVKTDEKITNELSSKYWLHSPPQSLIAESVSHSEFDRLLIANENVSTENGFINKIKNNSISKSNLSQYSEESLLTTLVQCQHLKENNMKQKLKRRINLNDQETCSKSLKPTSFDDSSNPLTLPDQSCLNERLINDHNNSNKVNLLNHSSSSSTTTTTTFNNTLDRKIKKTNHQSIMSNERKVGSTNQFLLDQMNNNHANLNKVELAKRCWENYFRPKPPRIRRNKTIHDHSMTQSFTRDMSNKVNDLCLRSSSVDCTYRTCENKNKRQYDEYLTRTSQFKASSMCISPITSNHSNNSTITDSNINQSESFPKINNQLDNNNNNNNNKIKYIGKGYSPSFIRLMTDHELDNNNNNNNINNNNNEQNCDQISDPDQLNDHYSNSTLTLTENTQTTKDHDHDYHDYHKINSNNSMKQMIFNEKRLCRSNIEFSNYNKEKYLNYYHEYLRPQSLTLKRHCIQYQNHNHKVNLSSSISSDHLHGINPYSDNDHIVKNTKKNHPYTCIDYITQTNDDNDDNNKNNHLNKHSDWSKLNIQKNNQFLKKLNKSFKQSNTPLIHHFIIPIYHDSRSYLTNSNRLNLDRKNDSSLIGIDRSESFSKKIKHISLNKKLKEISNDHLKHTTLSSINSPITTSNFIDTKQIENDYHSSIELLNHHQTKDKTTQKLRSYLVPFSEVNNLSLSQKIIYDSYINDDDDDEEEEEDDENCIDDHDDNYENEQVNSKLKMSLSPAAQRYEEHVLATVSGRLSYPKTNNQLYFNDYKNDIKHRNSIQKVKLLPEFQYHKNPIEIIKDHNYDDDDDNGDEEEEAEENDSNDHLNDHLIHTELWREKFGAITRWRHEVDNAMLAGETEIIHTPETILHNKCVKEKFNIPSISNQQDTMNYLQPTIVPINTFQSNGLYSTINDVEINYSTTCTCPIVQSYMYSKPLINSNEANETKQNIYYQPTSHSVPSKVVINPSGVTNDQTYQYDNNNNIRLDNSQQINSKYQPMWIKATIPQLRLSRQRSNSGNAVVLQPIQQIENFTNIPNYYSSNNPVNLTSNIQGSIHHSYEPNIPLPNINSPINRYKTSTVKSFRNFLTPKLRRKTYELDKTESIKLKQDDYKPINILQTNSVEQHLGNNNSRSINERNNQFKKVVPSTSYTDALNLAVAANTALHEAFNQSITSTDSCQKTNSTNQNTPVSFKQSKFKTTSSPVNPTSLIITNDRSSAEISLTPSESVKTEHKNNTCQWTKISKPYKNISLSPISSISQYNGDKNSPVEKQMDKNKFKTDTTEQTLYSDNKSRSSKLLISEKSDDLTETNTDTRRIPGRLRSSLRHAVTLSPCRRKPDVTLEQCNSPYLQPSPLALSSGFVSAGSIVNAVEECTEKMNKDGFAENSPKVKTVPPPVGVHDYPIVTNLEKDLNTIDSLINDTLNIHINDNNPQTKLNQSELSNNSTQKSNEQQQSKFNKLLPLQTLPPCKLLLGRVASNEDICIETETPFSFNIAATDKEICITRVASVEDLKCQQQQQQQQYDQLKGNINNKSIKKNHKRIPISLRLTFGSESKLNKSILNSNENDHLMIKNYRSMYYVDIPQGIKTNELKRKTNQLKNINNHNNKQNIIRYSLPCITYCEELPKPISLLPPLVIDKNR